jgi:hypothetical protein
MSAPNSFSATFKQHSYALHGMLTSETGHIEKGQSIRKMLFFAPSDNFYYMQHIIFCTSAEERFKHVIPEKLYFL